MVYYQKWKTNKYGNKTSIYDGYGYDSKFEASYAMELDALKKKGKIKDWRRQVKQDLRVNGEHITNYFVDFEVTHNDGSIELTEIKGFETETWRLKRKLLEATILKKNPDIKYTVIKQKSYYPYRKK